MCAGWGFIVPEPAQPTGSVPQIAATVRTLAELAGLLRLLRRREARSRGGAELTYRELAARTGWSHAIIGEYLTGTALPPTDRFDHLIQLLGATPTELGPLATARDRVEELRRRSRRSGPGGAAGGAGVAVVDRGRVPRELPAPVAGFVGRGDELAELDRIAAAGQAATGLPIVAICGAGGVGKTALARQWAHRWADEFPDGQLYIDLQGFGPRPPVAAREALGRFLSALGVEPGRMPAGVDERAARYRTVLAGRRTLVVLDNARSAEQVRPLLPGGAGNMVLVTSRDSLAGLVAADGAQRISIDVLPEAESLRLLSTLVTGPPERLYPLARLCGGLPLALRVADEIATAHPDRSLADLAASDDGPRMLLDAGDGHSVRSVLSWSYACLSAPAARMFRLLGAHPGPDTSTAAAASLAGAPVATARQLLGELARLHLVTELGPGRYALPALLRAYARDLLDGGSEDREPPIQRLLDHYLHTAARATQVLRPRQPPLALADPAPGTVVCDPTSAPRARAWLADEYRSLLAAARFAHDHGYVDHARQLERVLRRGIPRPDSSPVTTAGLPALVRPRRVDLAYAR